MPSAFNVRRFDDRTRAATRQHQRGREILNVYGFRHELAQLTLPARRGQRALYKGAIERRFQAKQVRLRVHCFG